MNYTAKNNIRIVTASSLFDGHDASINIMRRLLQASGVEVIHLGHNRSVKEIVECAIQEDVQAIAVSSYQGGHIEFYKYIYDMLLEWDCPQIKIFGGGGGVILPEEINELHNYGITHIYSPDEGRKLGLRGMINDLLERCDFPTGSSIPDVNEIINLKTRSRQIRNKIIAKTISTAENYPDEGKILLNKIQEEATKKNIPVIGITGTGGSGKSSLVDEMVRRFLLDFNEKTIGIISVDPSKRKTGGALLGDRIRMNSINNDRVYMRSLATRQSNLALSKYVRDAVNILKVAGFDLIILETSGIGQADTEITEHSDIAIYVMTSDYGAPSQLEKIDMLDYADIIALNKFDKRNSLDALREIRKQYARNHLPPDSIKTAEVLETMPVYPTIASQYNDSGVNQFYSALIKKLKEKNLIDFESTLSFGNEKKEKINIIPPERTRYLSEITEIIRAYNQTSETQAEIASKMYGLKKAISSLNEHPETIGLLEKKYQELEGRLSYENKEILENWESKLKKFREEYFVYKVRDKEIKVKTHTKSLSNLDIPKISIPKYSDWGDILKWNYQENFPGEFPFTAGVFPIKREEEDPARMFAGEGAPERTNKRFHYLSKGLPAVRLSTAFDSVTLYGENPDIRPDIYGKVGNSGVSICCLDDMKKLYSGFDLCDAKTSVSMTINGPAPVITAYFMNAAIDQQCEIYIKQNGLEEETKSKIDKIFSVCGLSKPVYNGEIPEGNNGLGLMLLGVTGDMILDKKIYEKIKKETLSKVRGTVQADILKEDQAQNTCIFSIDFSLKLMGDMQEYFINNDIGNFYTVSISGYHIAEAGANPVSQLAFTLANGFTYVEYYMSRGMHPDKFARNLSFFFSNGIDPEFSVIGRVARKIWAKAMKLKYNANKRSQQLKYHIQTSGRSLHAQEIEFNDIRTTLQALYAIYDNCNSLHTNAYDEAITTPTEESVRRALAIQMIINHELGLTKNQNPLQGSFIIEELTDIVESAVLEEFDRINERGGVLGAMESMYQRSKIQEESLYYETLKHEGKLPIIGVNTFLSSKGSPTILPKEVIRATEEEKDNQIKTLNTLHKLQENKSAVLLNELSDDAKTNKNLFESLMETVKYCSLGQITNVLYNAGGQYRRNM